MFTKTTIKDVQLENKNILIRTDFNVPIKDGRVQSDFRLQAAIPTLKYILSKSPNRLVIISHLGRPDGKIDPAFSLAPVATALSKLLNQPVKFIPKTVGQEVKTEIEAMPKGSVILLENLRFSPDEEGNSLDFAKQIVEDTDSELFVQDGFAVIHRAHASTSKIPTLLPTVSGLLIEKEIRNLQKVLESPAHPVTVIIGGAKISDKQPLIDRFLPLADHIIVVGKIAADGFSSDNPKIYVAEDFREDTSGNKLDIGDLSLAKILPLIAESQTIIWNGTAGKTEEPGFDLSSRKIAEAIGLKDPDTTQSVILGGDTAGYVEKLLEKHSSSLHFTLVSTGGGASLEFLLGLPLPGLDAIN